MSGDLRLSCRPLRSLAELCRKTSCDPAGDELESEGSYSPGPGWPVKPAAFRPAIGLKIISGLVLLWVLILMPARVLAQRGAGGHAGGARPGVVRAPVVRAPAPAVNRPVSVPPVITRPGTRPVGVAPITTLHTPMTPLRVPITPLPMPLTTGIRFPSRPPMRFPFTPVLGTAGFFGFRSNPFFNTGLFFPACSPFLGFSFGCGVLAPFYSINYGPMISYPPALAYPSDPTYPSDPGYTPPAPSATLQYTPPANPYPSFTSVPAEDLTAGSSAGARLRGETLLYLTDGSVFTVSSYTVSDGTLRYVTSYGEKNDVAVDRLDLKKTIEANAARGVAFTLSPAAPGSANSGPSPLGPAPAPEGPITPAKP